MLSSFGLIYGQLRISKKWDQGEIYERLFEAILGLFESILGHFEPLGLLGSLGIL